MEFSRAVLRSVAAEVAEGLPELCGPIVGVIAAREAPYGARGVVVVEDLRGTVRANLTGMLDVLSGVGTIGERELSVPRSTGRRRAKQGVPLEAVLRAYSLAGQSLMSALLARAQRRSAAELAAFLEVATAALEVVDRYSQAVVESYRQAESRRRDAQRQQVMFDALLDGRGADPAVVAEAASLLGLPASGPYVMLVGTLDPAADQTLTAARDACAAYGFTATPRASPHRTRPRPASRPAAAPRGQRTRPRPAPPAASRSAAPPVRSARCRRNRAGPPPHSGSARRTPSRPARTAAPQ